MKHSKLIIGVFLIAMCQFVVTGCGAMAGALAAMSEDPSIEVSLDRVDAIQRSTASAKYLLNKAAIGGNSWPSDLMGIVTQQQQLETNVRSSGAHNMRVAQLTGQPVKSYTVSHARIFADFTGKFVDGLKKKPAKGHYPSVMNAFGTLYGEPGAVVLEKQASLDSLIDGVGAAKDVLAKKEEQLETLEEDEGAEPDMIAAAKKAIDEQEVVVDEKEDALDKATDEVLLSIEACAGAPLEASDHTNEVLMALNYAAHQYSANEAAGAMVLIQLPRAIPDAPAELQSIAMRLLFETMGDLAAEALPTITVTIEDGALALVIMKDDVPMNSATVKRAVIGRVMKLYDRVVLTITSLGSILTESATQSKIVSAMADAMSKSTGTPLGPYDFQ